MGYNGNNRHQREICVFRRGGGHVVMSMDGGLWGELARMIVLFLNRVKDGTFRLGGLWCGVFAANYPLISAKTA
ncbi:MAG: hypothetical protein HUU55_04040 [Myxococcales bacterium]|nr:hypothetical protein [Myxococcales bacterium]